MKRIGVFVCHCGLNIAGTVDVERVAEEIRKYPGVAHAVEYKYMCSDPGQNLIKEAIREHKLNRVVVAACTPRTHEPVFREVLARTGLNPFLFEMVNIRDQCTWVHSHVPEEAQTRARDQIRMSVARAARLEPLEPVKVEVCRRALVLGGGLAGMRAALDLEAQGYEVGRSLVEEDMLDTAEAVLERASSRGVTLELPSDVVVADAIGIYGGYLVSVVLMGANPVSYMDNTFRFMDLSDLSSGLIKAAFFGMLIAVVGCQQGLYTRGGAEGVGRSTTRSVVVASIAILISDFFLTKVLF